MTTTDYRLPREVTPLDYAVVLDATPARAAFSGEVTVSVRVHRPVEAFELHARDLKVSDVVATVGKKKLKAKVVAHVDRETVELRFREPLPKGKHTVRVAFRGKLNPNMHGLYLAKDGRERAIVSQCEATDARGIFPCFDEPDLKARLGWTVRTDAGLTVVTNGVLKSRKKLRGKPAREEHVFRATRVIPTYLAAVTIGRYETTKARRIVKIASRVVTGPNKSDQTAFAQDVTAFVLPWYEKYFGHRYNYEKLDQVAVPGFDAGAMENVGAVFYRQNLLLMRPGAASWFAQKRIAEVIAHELAHQWFGNLVTMKWWDDLWLNEAFATWIAYKAVDTWHPDWRMWDDYLESKEGALAADALVNTHPIYTSVRTPAEATELFDLITYEKGCAVLRMAESYLGDEAFRAGIRLYVQRYKNANAAGADLWACLAEASSQPVDSLMRSWITQGGFPLVSAQVKREGGRTKVLLEQRRFFADPEQAQRSNEQLWDIPLIILYGTGDKVAAHRTVVRERRAVVELPTDASVSWVYPNAGATGFYRIAFAPEDLRALLRHGLPQLSPGERKGLLEDQWALVRNGLTDISAFLDTVCAFRDERDHTVVRSLAARLATIDQRLVRDADRPAFAELARWLLGDQLGELGWTAAADEEPQHGARRAAVVETLGDVGRDAAVLSRAGEEVAREMSDPAAVEANLAGTLVGLHAIGGDMARLRQYVSVFAERKREGAPPQLQSRYLDALAYFESPDVIEAVLALCLDGTVPQEQLRLVLSNMLSRRTTQRATWAFIKRNWQELGPRSGAMGISRLVEATGSLPVDLRADVQGFFEKHDVPEARRALQKALEAMELRRKLVEREAERLGKWLRRGPVAVTA